MSRAAEAGAVQLLLPVQGCAGGTAPHRAAACQDTELQPQIGAQTGGSAQPQLPARGADAGSGVTHSCTQVPGSSPSARSSTPLKANCLHPACLNPASPTDTNWSSSCVLSRALRAEADLAEDQMVATRPTGNPLTFKGHRGTSEQHCSKCKLAFASCAFPCNYFGEGFVGSAGLQGGLSPADCL